MTQPLLTREFSSDMPSSFLKLNPHLNKKDVSTIPVGGTNVKTFSIDISLSVIFEKSKIDLICSYATMAFCCPSFSCTNFVLLSILAPIVLIFSSKPVAVLCLLSRRCFASRSIVSVCPCTKSISSLIISTSLFGISACGPFA